MTPDKRLIRALNALGGSGENKPTDQSNNEQQTGAAQNPAGAQGTGGNP